MQDSISITELGTQVVRSRYKREGDTNAKFQPGDKEWPRLKVVGAFLKNKYGIKGELVSVDQHVVEGIFESQFSWR